MSITIYGLVLRQPMGLLQPILFLGPLYSVTLVVFQSSDSQPAELAEIWFLVKIPYFGGPSKMCKDIEGIWNFLLMNLFKLLISQFFWAMLWPPNFSGKFLLLLLSLDPKGSIGQKKSPEDSDRHTYRVQKIIKKYCLPWKVLNNSVLSSIKCQLSSQKKMLLQLEKWYQEKKVWSCAVILPQ